MTDPIFRAKVRPVLTPAAEQLVQAYDNTYGSASPGCCPEALASVLSALAAIDASPRDLLELAAGLRGQAFP